MGLWNMIKREYNDDCLGVLSDQNCIHLLGKKKKNAEEEVVMERSISEGNVMAISSEKKNSFPFGFSPQKSNKNHHHSKHHHYKEKAEFFADNLITAETIEDFSSSPETSKHLFLNEITSSNDNILPDNSILTKIVRNRASPNSTINSTLDNESILRPPSPKPADTTIEESIIEHKNFEDEVRIQPESSLLNQKLPSTQQISAKTIENDVTEKAKKGQRKAINETEVIENHKLLDYQSKPAFETDETKGDAFKSPTTELRSSTLLPTDEQESENPNVQQPQASLMDAVIPPFSSSQEETINTPEECPTKEAPFLEETVQSHVAQSDLNTFPSQELAQLEHKEFTRFIESELLKLKDDLQTDKRIGDSVNQQRVPSPLPKEKTQGHPSHPQSLTLNLDAKYKYARRALLRQYLKNKSLGDKMALGTVNNSLDLNTSLKLQRLEKENKELERLQAARKKYAKDLVKLEKLVEIATIENEVEASQQKSHVVIVDKKKKDHKGALSKGYSDILQNKMEMMGKTLVSSSDELTDADPEVLLKQINLLKSEREKFQALVEKQKETIRVLSEDLLTDVEIDPNEKQKLVEQVITNHSLPESPAGSSTTSHSSSTTPQNDFNLPLVSEDQAPSLPIDTPLTSPNSKHSEPSEPQPQSHSEPPLHTDTCCNPALKPKKKKSKKTKKKSATKESSASSNPTTSATTTTIKMESPSSASPELPKDCNNGSNNTTHSETKKRSLSARKHQEERPSSALGISRKNISSPLPSSSHVGEDKNDTRKVLYSEHYSPSVSCSTSNNRSTRRPMSASRSSSSVKSSSTLITAVASPNSESLSRIAQDATKKRRPSSACATSSRYDKIIDRLYEGGIEKQNKSREWARTQKELKEAKELQEMREKPQLNRKSIEIVNRKYQAGDFMAPYRGSSPLTDFKPSSPSYMTISSDGVIMQTPVSLERPRSGGSIEELRLLRQESMRRRTREFNIMKESLAECTFTPNIGRKSLEIVSQRKTKDEPIHNKLFEEAKEKEAQNAKIREM